VARHFCRYPYHGAGATRKTLTAYHKAEIDKWWPIIRAAKIKVEAH